MRSLILVGMLLLVGVCAQAEIGPHWIFFAPRPESAAVEAISPLAAARLERLALAPNSADLPVWEPWMAELRDLGIRPRVRSRYLHAVSASLDEAQIAAVRALPFVEGISPVRSFGHLPPREIGAEMPAPMPQGIAEESYGLGIWQLAMLGIPDLHAEGLSGAGVRIAILDSGFCKDHATFSAATLGGERDFVYGDDNVQNDDVGDEHGTLTFSVLGGYDPDRLIGAAPGATYLLARTEEISWERAVEEDHFVAGLEWADSMGAAIVSASLGYLDFPDDEEPWSYAPEQLDGQTAVTTRGVNRAAERGILVVAAAGNSGPGDATLLVPGDSDAALTVGAVEPWGEIASFSSRGPTADGRIKPDIVAQGDEVLGARNTSIPGPPPGYGYAQGTSLATPLIAGLAALVLEREPGLGPEELKSAILSSASRAADPNSSYGCGIPWGPAAVSPGEAAVIVDSLRWSAMPVNNVRLNLEVRLRNVGGAVSEGQDFGPSSSTGEGALTCPPARISSLNPGETVWVGPWEIYTGSLQSQYYGATVGWGGLAFQYGRDDGSKRTQYVRFKITRRLFSNYIGFHSVSPSPWTGTADLEITYLAGLLDSPTIDIYDVNGRLRRRFHPEPATYLATLRLASEDVPDIRSGRYFLYLRGEGYSDRVPILIIR